jgi:hypothetical protein
MDSPNVILLITDDRGESRGAYYVYAGRVAD